MPRRRERRGGYRSPREERRSRSAAPCWSPRAPVSSSSSLSEELELEVMKPGFMGCIPHHRASLLAQGH